MAKRYGKSFENNNSNPSKKAKLDITVTCPSQVVREKKPPSVTQNVPTSDPWGDDFNDDEIEEMDFVASQVVSESEIPGARTMHTKSVTKSVRHSYQKSIDPKPSTSRTYLHRETLDLKKTDPKTLSTVAPQFEDRGQKSNPSSVNPSHGTSQYQQQPSQKISSSDNLKGIYKDERSILFDDFKDNLLNANNHNSTFHSQVININSGTIQNSKASKKEGRGTINISDDSILRQLEKLKLENQKLLDNFITKEGETAFLRSQLQQTQHRAEHDKMEKARIIEEQANQFRSEINVALKEKESLKTQLGLQTLQLNNLKEKCKLLATGSVKLVQPHTAQIDSGNRNRLNTTLGRSSSVVKTVQVTESGVQTIKLDDRLTYKLKALVEKYPFSKIPQSIFESSRVEPSVVDIQIIEKVGKRNLPILQDEENFRIFENPDLVKPIVTIVNKQQLNVEFCAPEVAALMKKSHRESNNHDLFPIINKLVATARELLLNTTQVLVKISEVIRNDDIRDMNDLYFSDFYKMHVDSTKSICDSYEWHEKERGIEARRSLAILFYVAPASNYLSDYLTGIIPLKVSNDMNYQNYIQEMSTYNKWSKKDSQHEMLEMLLEFVTTVGFVRRSHQFSGLIIAILKLLISVEKKIVQSEERIRYVCKIFREVIFGRPLLVCYTAITEFMMTFSQCIQFAQDLCVGSSQSAITVWKDALHFTPDACVMQIYIAQLEFFQPDPIATIGIGYALICLVLNILSTDNLPWVTEPEYRCQCSMKLYALAIHFLYKCSKVNIEEAEKMRTDEYETTGLKDPNSEFYLTNYTGESLRPGTSNSNSKKTSFNLAQLCDHDKMKIKHKQINTIRKGIIFLCNLSTRDPDFIMRVSDIEDSFNLFVQQIESLEYLTLNQHEKIALTSVKSTFIFDKTILCEESTEKRQTFPGFEKHFRPKDKSIRTNTVQIPEMVSRNVIPQSNTFSWLSELIDERKRKSK